MKNIQTKLAGLLAGLPLLASSLYEAYSTGGFTGKSGLTLITAIGVIVLGWISKQYNVTGGTVPQTGEAVNRTDATIAK